MKLRRENEVAIAILVACARSNDCRLKTADAAKVAETTPDFAAHVVLKLVNAGFLKT
jgi:DNA-binding IscR family transcriptional regulator